MPGAPVAPGSGKIRRILPFGSLEFADVRWASHGCRPARSSIGVKPDDSNGLVLSPVEM
jgi:hypothetical protein